jgi:hypothetical protein
MPLDARRTLALLRKLDDPDHLEFPRGYDHGAVRARFNQLATRLEQRFECTCGVDRDIQDASHHGIIVPATATAGNLAAVALGNPGSYSEEEDQDLFHGDDRQRVEDELDALHYIALSEHRLWTTYDGVSGLASPSGHPPTWWTRYFDYL